MRTQSAIESDLLDREDLIHPIGEAAPPMCGFGDTTFHARPCVSGIQ